MCACTDRDLQYCHTHSTYIYADTNHTARAIYSGWPSNITTQSSCICPLLLFVTFSR